jgi:hypothetical protein
MSRKIRLINYGKKDEANISFSNNQLLNNLCNYKIFNYIKSYFMKEVKENSSPLEILKDIKPPPEKLSKISKGLDRLYRNNTVEKLKEKLAKKIKIKNQWEIKDDDIENPKDRKMNNMEK